VRSVGATNVLLIPGISWAEDLRSWLYYKPSDPLHNVVASWHFYAAENESCLTSACFTQGVGAVASGVPLILDEFGADSNSKNCDPQLFTGIGTLLNWLDQHDDGYAAFAWDVLPGAQPCGSLALITDYSGTPHAPNGTQYKAHLLMITSSGAKPTQTP
jgi:hypothetical protein